MKVFTKKQKQSMRSHTQQGKEIRQQLQSKGENVAVKKEAKRRQAALRGQ